MSAFSRIRVRRDGDVRTVSFVREDGQESVQSRVSLTAPGTLLSPYAPAMFASYLYQPEPRRVLIVGLGGGAMVRFLTAHEPHVYIDAVEIDPVVVRLADEFFGVRSGGNVRVHTADAVAFVESVTERYDLILMDAFLRPSGDTDTTGVPTRLKTLAFLGRLKQALAPGGVVAFNLNEHASVNDDIAAVTTVFGHAVVYRCPPASNKVVIATEGALPTDDVVRARIGALDPRFQGALSLADVMRNREQRAAFAVNDPLNPAASAKPDAAHVAAPDAPANSSLPAVTVRANPSSAVTTPRLSVVIEPPITCPDNVPRLTSRSRSLWLGSDSS